jgi:F-type H+-transporting ATPase subunit epsilon
MNTIKLNIITPEKIAITDEVESLTVPAASGELTILHNHVPLFSLLEQGIVKMKKNNKEEFMAIGGGYLEVTGTEVNLLVSSAYGQDEIDEKLVKEAQEKAKTLLTEAKTDEERHEALMTMRRSTVDLKLLKKVRRRA